MSQDNIQSVCLQTNELDEGVKETVESSEKVLRSDMEVLESDLRSIVMVLESKLESHMKVIKREIRATR